MNILRNSRYHLNPKHLRYIRISPVLDQTYSAICSSGFPLFHQYFAPKSSKSYLLCNFSTGSNSFLHSGFSSYVSSLCWNYSTFAVINNSSDTSTKKSVNLDDHEGSVNVIKGIIDIVKNDASDMESRLDLLGVNLSKRSIIEVFCVLNQLKVPALRFFDWIKNSHSRYSRNADLCSLAVDNCGRLGDFGALRSLLKDFHVRNICLSEKAFAFLNIADDTGESAKKSITEIVGLLNEVGGGSSRSSGIHSLITMLCSLDLIDLAKFAIEITEKKASYYNILVKHLCVIGHLKDAQDLISEMNQLKCDMNYTPYNYLISSLCVRGRIDEACSIPKEMINRECLPNELTFEILIYFTCRYGRSDDAINLCNEMLSSGIKHRLPTHIAFIRGYVSGQHFDKAYKYIIELAAIDKFAATHLYNVLASLHIEHGDLLVAYKLLFEMLEKGFNPKFSVYRRASIRLCKTGRAELAKTLDARYSSLVKELR
ncbi:uncharacterized protein LOC141612200 [Silene latifolia]|uniref:uncharacterized protein LOC141612200 n=1 Tax=Silene latifolia TaxID=37657 RepID=UPI003D78557E